MLIRSRGARFILAFAIMGADPGAHAVQDTVIEPTPEPLPEPPQRVELKLQAEETNCGVAYKVETEESGALSIAFEDLFTSAAQGKYRASCRLGGSITIPKGYGLEPALALKARVQGQLRGGIDNVTGRLRITLGRYAGRDFELTEYAPADPETPIQNVNINLKTQLPEIPRSCTEDLTWTVSLFVESTINGRAASSIEGLRLDGLKLVPLDCNRSRIVP